MPRQRHETRLDAPITSVFAALIDVVARGRWGAAHIVLDAPQPRPGCEYAQQRRRVLRRGKVLECLRPVTLTLEETLLDRPCRVKLRLKWRLEPLETTRACCSKQSYTLNGAASLRRRHWDDRSMATARACSARCGPKSRPRGARSTRRRRRGRYARPMSRGSSRRSARAETE